MSLVKYASLRRLQLITAADFNEKLHERGAPRMVTVQKICRSAKNETEVREALDAMWKDPTTSEAILRELWTRNEELYKFEEILEDTKTNIKPLMNDRVVSNVTGSVV